MYQLQSVMQTAPDSTLNDTADDEAASEDEREQQAQPYLVCVCERGGNREVQGIPCELNEAALGVLTNLRRA
jgi:hypothetical protein